MRWGGYTLVGMTFLSIILGVLGVAVLIVGVLSTTGTLPGNSIIGLRIPEVRKSQEYWTMGHKIAGPTWTGSGLALLACAVVAWGASGWLWLIVGLLVVAAVFLLGMGAALASHALAQVDARAQKEAEADGAATCCSSASAPVSDVATSPSAPAGACCSDGGAATAGAAGAAGVNGAQADGVVSAEACASGQACGSCSLNGSCEGGGAAFDACGGASVGSAPAAQDAAPASPAAAPAPAVPALDLDAARRAAASQDER